VSSPGWTRYKPTKMLRVKKGPPKTTGIKSS
jgi:hypothetical protein